MKIKRMTPEEAAGHVRIHTALFAFMAINLFLILFAMIGVLLAFNSVGLLPLHI